jgi:uncharacterized protein involved in exopolysaccharide biosynthesis
MEMNRRYRDSPELEFQYDSLSRDVTLRQEVYLTLSRELETARIEALNDAPVLTVIERARPPARPSGPRHLVMAAAAFLAGLAIAMIAVSVQEYRRRLAGQRPAEYAEFQTALQAFAREALPLGKRARRG